MTLHSPFIGIGSVGDEAIRRGRRFVGTELKPEYFQLAVRNLKRAEKNKATGDLFQGEVA